MINKSDTFVSALLGKTSIAFSNEEYISEKLMPIISVKKDSAQIVTYGMDNLRVVEALRAQGAGANEVNHSITIGEHYNLKDHAVKEFVSQEEMENADNPINPKIDATENLTERMWVIKEKQLADTMSNTSIITQNVTLSWTSQWSDLDNSTPFEDIKTALETIRSSTGKMPNTLVFSYAIMMTLLIHPNVNNRIINSTGVVTSELAIQVLMQAFPGIKNILIGSAQFNSGVEGGSDVLADIWGKNAWALFIEPKPRLKSRSFGFTYQKNWQNRKVKILPFDEDKMGNFVRVNDYFDQKFIDVNCAFLIKDAIA